METNTILLIVINALLLLIIFLLFRVYISRRIPKKTRKVSPKVTSRKTAETQRHSEEEIDDTRAMARGMKIAGKNKREITVKLREKGMKEKDIKKILEKE